MLNLENVQRMYEPPGIIQKYENGATAFKRRKRKESIKMFIEAFYSKPKASKRHIIERSGLSTSTISRIAKQLLADRVIKREEKIIGRETYYYYTRVKGFDFASYLKG